MHIVFFNHNQYSSFQEALKGNLRTDLVVMSVLFEVKFEFSLRKEILYYSTLCNCPQIAHGDQPMFAFTGRMQELTKPTSFIDYNFKGLDILPRNLKEFYEFDGSLTTPPYSEITTWIVYPETMYISSNQVQHSRQKIASFMTLKYYLNFYSKFCFSCENSVRFSTIKTQKYWPILERYNPSEIVMCITLF